VQVLITRPREAAAALASELEARGHSTLIEPLLTIEPIRSASLDLDGVQAIILTSANAAPALEGTIAPLPVFVVGEATAMAARRAGWTDVRVAAGDASSLARMIRKECRPSGGALLHLSGTDVRPGLAEQLAAAGFVLRRQPVYRAVAAVALSSEVIEALRREAIDAVLLFSPRTAAVFAELIARHDLAGCLGGTEAICLSTAVAESCGRLTWRAVRVAARPELAMLLRRLEGAERRC
jgi:uroporphyrinogen-III synthase